MAEYLYVITVCSGFLFKKSKIVTIFIFAVMFILTAFCYSNADRGSYEIGYYWDEFEHGTRYIGYDYVNHLFMNAGISFDNYIVCYYSVSLFILFFSLKLLSSHTNLVLSLFLISYFGIEAIQLKSFIADTLVLLVFSLYFYRGKEYFLKNKRKILLLLCIFIIAASMHYSVMFYAITFLLFLCFKNKSNYKKYLLIFIALLAFFVMVGGLNRILGTFLTAGLMSDNGANYLSTWTEGSNRLGYLLTWFVVFLIYALLFLEERYRKHSKLVNDTLDAKGRDILLYLYTIGLMLPLLYVDMTFDRLFRIYFFLLFCYFSRYALKKRVTYHEISLFFIIVFIAIYEFFLDVYPAWDGTLGALLTKNIFLN